MEASADLLPVVNDELRRLRHGDGLQRVADALRLAAEFGVAAARLRLRLPTFEGRQFVWKGRMKKNGWRNESPAVFMNTQDQVVAGQFDCIAK